MEGLWNLHARGRAAHRHFDRHADNDACSADLDALPHADSDSPSQPNRHSNGYPAANRHDPAIRYAKSRSYGNSQPHSFTDCYVNNHSIGDSEPHSFAILHVNDCAAADTDPNVQALGHTSPNSYRISRRDCQRTKPALGARHSYAHAHADQHRDARPTSVIDPDPGTDLHVHAHACPDRYAASFIHTDRHSTAYLNGYVDARSDADLHRDSYGGSSANPDANTAPNQHTRTNSDTHASAADAYPNKDRHAGAAHDQGLLHEHPAGR